jgi:hypothetical protein
MIEQKRKNNAYRSLYPFIVIRAGHAGDAGGIFRDIIARGELIPGLEPFEFAVEVKHQRVVDRPQVQLALKQNEGYPALLFVTSGRFTAGVYEEKLKPENRLRLRLMEGVALGKLIQDYFRRTNF